MKTHDYQLKDKHEVNESVYIIENAADDERNLYKVGKSQCPGSPPTTNPAKRGVGWAWNLFPG